MKKLTKERWIPEGYVEFKPELGEYPKEMFACYVDLARLRAIFYVGKQSKHAWYNSFHTEEDMKKKITTSIKNCMTHEESKEKRKIEKKESYNNALAGMKVGDLYYSSWGYEQTNVDFYQVTEIKGKSFTVREIQSKTVEGSTMPHGMADERVAIKDSFLDEKRYPPRTLRTFKLNSYSWLYPNNENKPHYCSWYA